MPIGFILIFLLCMALFYYKKFEPLKQNKTILIFSLLLMLLGYLIGNIDINYTFSINTIFSFISMVLCLNILRKSGVNSLISAICLAITLSVAYYFITLNNTDFYTFFNYYYAIVAIIILSLLFINNANAGIGFIMLSTIGLEIINLFNVNSHLGYLNIFGYQTVNYMTISIFIYSVLHFIVAVIFKNKIKFVKKERLYENKTNSN